MPILGLLSFTLEVPSLDEGITFYTDAGLTADSDGMTARLRCADQDRACIMLIGGAARKRLHHVALRASDLVQIAGAPPDAGGQDVDAPAGLCDRGL